MFSFRSVRSVVWSGFRSGGLWSAVLRPSRRSPSGWVVVLVFRSPVAASRFARSFAPLVGVPLAVRSRVAVSVPVAVVGSRPAGVGRPVSAVGGLRSFAASVRSAGWVSLAVSSC